MMPPVNVPRMARPSGFLYLAHVSCWARIRTPWKKLATAGVRTAHQLHDGATVLANCP